MEIRANSLGHRKVAQLLSEHLRGMAELSPPESVHALGLDGLHAPDISFWSVWDGDELLGCGALRELDAGHGEIKSMRTASAHRGKGVASHLLQYLLDEAARRGYTRLSLETGSMAGFAPAHRLYERFGFVPCAPFADYREDPNSLFLSLDLPG
jgi:putative acetyltransferase